MLFEYSLPWVAVEPESQVYCKIWNWQKKKKNLWTYETVISVAPTGQLIYMLIDRWDVGSGI